MRQSDYDDPISAFNKDYEWDYALSKNIHNWRTMNSANWGNFAVLIYYGNLSSTRYNDAEKLKLIVERSIKF